MRCERSRCVCVCVCVVVVVCVGGSGQSVLFNGTMEPPLCVTGNMVKMF